MATVKLSYSQTCNPIDDMQGQDSCQHAMMDRLCILLVCNSYPSFEHFWLGRMQYPAWQTEAIGHWPENLRHHDPGLCVVCHQLWSHTLDTWSLAWLRRIHLGHNDDGHQHRDKSTCHSGALQAQLPSPARVHGFLACRENCQWTRRAS